MKEGKRKILLVEDEALNYLDLKQFLEAEGFKVLSLPGKAIIDNYDDAIRACENEIPHIAILDIQIKGEKDGLDIAAFIRENYYSPVIILSGYDTDENIRRAGIIGIDGFTKKMEKPHNLQQLKINLGLLLPLAETAAKRREENIFLFVKAYNEAKPDTAFSFRRIALSDLIFIKTLPGIKNNVFLEMKNGQKYVSHKPLKEFADDLPVNFVRFSGDRIINTNFIDGKGKSQWVYFVGPDRFEIADAYRSEELKAILNKLQI